MNVTSELANRLRELQGAQSARNYARQLGLGEATYRKLLAGGNPRLDTLLQIQRNAGVSLQWLATGEGSRIADPSPAGFADDGAPFDAGSVPTDFRLIPRLDVQPSSGFGALAADEGPLEMLAFRADWLRRVGINPEHARVLTNRGDSNEPTIRDGDVLLVDTSINHIVDNAFYIVVFNGLALLKRVQLRRDGSVVLSSDNKLAYQDEIVPLAEVPDLRIAARLMWFGRSI